MDGGWYRCTIVKNMFSYWNLLMLACFFVIQKYRITKQHLDDGTSLLRQTCCQLLHEFRCIWPFHWSCLVNSLWITNPPLRKTNKNEHAANFSLPRYSMLMILLRDHDVLYHTMFYRVIYHSSFFIVFCFFCVLSRSYLVYCDMVMWSYRWTWVYVILSTLIKVARHVFICAHLY